MEEEKTMKENMKEMSLLDFWKDITHLLEKIANFFKSLFNKAED